MMKYLRVYREFINTSFAEATSFRVSFFLLIIMDLFFYCVTLSSVYFIFDHVPNIGPWQRDTFLFFIAFLLVVDQLHMSLISEGFWEFSDQIRTGKLDFILLKPIGSIFNVFFRHIRPASFVNFIPVWSVMIWFGLRLDLAWYSWLLLPLLVIFSLTLLVSFEILVSMLMFMTVESFGINFLRMEFQKLSRWPDFVYRFYTRKFFTFVVPILLIGSAPVRFLLELRDWHLLGYMGAATVVLWAAIRHAWQFGLRHYESASS